MVRALGLIIGLACAQLLGSNAAHAHASAPEIKNLIAAGRAGSASYNCDLAQAAAAKSNQPLDAAMRKVCGQANLALGDKLARVRSYREAMKRWRKAATFDPELADRPDYVRRLETGLSPGDTGRSSVRTRKPATAPPKQPVTRKVPRRAPKTRKAPARKPPRRVTVAKIKPEFPEGSRGPRHGRIIGLGITGGWDGVFGFSVGWMHAERVAIELATDLFFSTLDTRIKVFGLKEAFTPFIGIGMLTPFGQREKNASGGQRVIPRFGLDIPRYGNLFAIGQMLHVDIGISWAVWKAEISAGAAFYTSFDAEDPNQIIFFPQFGAQVMFYLP